MPAIYSNTLKTSIKSYNNRLSVYVSENKLIFV